MIVKAVLNGQVIHENQELEDADRQELDEEGDRDRPVHAPVPTTAPLPSETCGSSRRSRFS